MDWKLQDKDKIASMVIDNVQDGSIVLLHDIHERSVDAVQEIISNLKYQSYEFVTVTELLFNE